MQRRAGAGLQLDAVEVAEQRGFGIRPLTARAHKDGHDGFVALQRRGFLTRKVTVVLVSSRSQTLFGNARPRNSVSQSSIPEPYSRGRFAETEFRGHPFPNWSLG